MPGTAAQWAPIAAFWLVLFAIAAVESLRPLRIDADRSGRRLITNIALGLINAGIISLVPVSTVIAAAWAADHRLGLLNLLALPAIAGWTATILLRSLASYWLHRLSHAVPLLWRVHRIPIIATPRSIFRPAFATTRLSWRSACWLIARWPSCSACRRRR
jgi:sterol desaturase/sphingolipid hydroxylase (fatty acid hydroxylase superfamily)